jgi:hypothetical protein
VGGRRRAFSLCSFKTLIIYAKIVAITNSNYTLTPLRNSCTRRVSAGGKVFKKLTLRISRPGITKLETRTWLEAPTKEAPTRREMLSYFGAGCCMYCVSCACLWTCVRYVSRVRVGGGINETSIPCESFAAIQTPPHGLYIAQSKVWVVSL